MATGSDGAGIGSGYGFGQGFHTATPSETSSVATLAIYGGNITATGTYRAGIGSGSGDASGSDTAAPSGTSSVAALTVRGGNTTATGSRGAGIGSGYRSGSRTAVSQVPNIVVFDGVIGFGSSSSGIDHDPSGSPVANLTVCHGLFDCSSLKSGICFSASSLTFANESAIALTNQTTVGASSQTQISGSPQLYFQYLSKSVPEGLTSLPLLHFESITFPYPAPYTLTIREIGPLERPFERTVQFDPRRLRGCAISVPRIGNYTILCNSTVGNVSDLLAHDGIPAFVVSGLYDHFYSTASYYTVLYIPPTAVFGATDFFGSTSLCSPTNLFRPTPSFSPTELFTPDFRLRWHQSRRTIVRFRLCSFLMSVSAPFPF
jgi:hypothetical protein